MSTADSGPKPFFSLAALPLFIAYGAFPATSIAARHWFGDAMVGGPEAILLGLAGFAVFVSMLKPRTGKTSWARSLFFFAIFAVMLSGLILYVTPTVGGSAEAMSWIGETRPLAFGLFGLLWAWTFGKSREHDFLFWGAALGVLALVDTALNSLDAGEFVLPGTPAEVETWGALLAIAVCVRFCSDEARDSSLVGSAMSLLAIAGVMAAMSRTGLLGLALSGLFLARGSLIRRAVFILSCVGVAAVSFMIPEQGAAILSRLTQHWMWWTGLTLVQQQPHALLFGFPVAEPLPIMTPETLQLVLGSTRLYPGDFSPFWLHTLLSWGLAGVAAVNALVLAALVKRPSRLAGGVLLLAAILGVNHELLYSSQTAVPLILALVLGFGKARGIRPAPGTTAGTVA